MILLQVITVLGKFRGPKDVGEERELRKGTKNRGFPSLNESIYACFCGSYLCYVWCALSDADCFGSRGGPGLSASNQLGPGSNG